MQNTSLGYHTFQFFQKTNDEDFSLLTDDFIAYANQNNEMKRFPIISKEGISIGWKYVYEKSKGIQWLLLSRHFKSGYTTQGVSVIINPKAMLEGNYIRAAQENDLELVEDLFNKEAAKISPILSKFGFSSLSRVDHCLNIDLEELDIPCSPKQMMTLIKRANIPKHFKELEIYDKTSHRKTTSKNSFYLQSKSAVINFYWKYPQQTEKHPNFIQRENSKNVIRFEVQCKYPKLYTISKENRYESKYCELTDELSLDELYEYIIDHVQNPSIPADIVLSDRISEEIIKKYFYKIVRKGDYFTLDGAREIVESYNFRRDKEERLIYALEQISKARGIADVKSKMLGCDLDDFKQSLRDLDDILVNPVTIPKGWKIRHIPNLLRAYYDSVYDEQLISTSEYLILKRIDEFLLGDL